MGPKTNIIHDIPSSMKGGSVGRNEEGLTTCPERVQGQCLLLYMGKGNKTEIKKAYEGPGGGVEAGLGVRNSWMIAFPPR